MLPPGGYFAGPQLPIHTPVTSNTPDDMAGPKLVRQLKKLRAVQAVAETGNTVQAAGRLHLSQSAVARAIQDVEQALGLPLFERSTRGMHPTPLGARLTERVGRALALLAQTDTDRLIPLSPGGTGAHWHRSRLATTVGFRHIRAFLALQSSGHVKQVAAELGVSLSAVHQTLGQLEHLAGRALYSLGQQGVRLTETGEALGRIFKLAQAELAQADEEISAQQGKLRAHLVIGTLPFSTSLFLPQALEATLAQHAGLSINVVDGTYEALLHKLRHAEIDLLVGALRSRPPFPDVRQEPLFEDPLCVVGRPGHLLAAKPHQDLGDLAHASWIHPMPGTPAQTAFEEAFRNSGLKPPAASLRVNSPPLILALLSSGDRLALMSRRQAQSEVQAGRLCILPVAVRHAPRRIGITLRQDFLPSPASQLLLEQIRLACTPLQSQSTTDGMKQIA